MNHPTLLIATTVHVDTNIFPWLRRSLVLAVIALLLLGCFQLMPMARAVSPAPDGGYSNANTAEGTDALFSLTTGSSNTATGYQTLYTNTTGSQNTATGYGALSSNSTGTSNTASGALAMEQNTTGSRNTASGQGALSGNTTGNNNTASGVHTLSQNGSGSNNTATGYLTLFTNKNGSNNTGTGNTALFSNTAGYYNTADGDTALYTNTTGYWNTAIGALALFNNNGNYNTACGAEALQNNTTGNNNVASGLSSLFTNSSGSNNTANGFIALYYNTTGHDNTAVGFQALNNNQTGNNNVALGMNAGFNLTTGSNNIVIGAGVTGAAGEANKIRIGKSTHTAAFIGGIYNRNEGGTIKPVYINSNGQLGTQPPASSRRFKEAIKPMDQTSEAILGLKPVMFRYKNDGDATPQFGLVAEEVAKANPDLVLRDDNGEIYTVRYDAVNAMLLNEFLKEHRKVQEQQATIACLKNEFESKLAKQQKQIEALTTGLQTVTAQVEAAKSVTLVADHN